MGLGPSSRVPDSTFDASDEKAVAKREAEAKLRDEARLAFVRSMLSTPQGREWWGQTLKDLHCFEQRIAVTGSDRENWSFEGEREAGLKFLRVFCVAAPTEFAQMIKDHG